jgi:hypothetical protein
MEAPSTPERVPEHTDPAINERIERQIEMAVAYYVQHPDEIEDRLAELDRTWNVERVLEANAATLALFGTAMTAFVDRRWAVLPLAVTGFLLQHATQGWCPPLPVLRRLGYRTPQEIEAERYALKAVRGDFRGLPEEGERHQEALQATGRF